MARDFAKAFYNSKAWKETSAAFKQSKHGLCERCGCRVQPRNMIVHHKIYLTANNINDVEITLNWNNLELLCKECHNKEHMSTESVEKNLTFNNKGELVKSS